MNNRKINPSPGAYRAFKLIVTGFCICLVVVALFFILQTSEQPTTNAQLPIAWSEVGKQSKKSSAPVQSALTKKELEQLKKVKKAVRLLHEQAESSTDLDSNSDPIKVKRRGFRRVFKLSDSQIKLLASAVSDFELVKDDLERARRQMGAFHDPRVQSAFIKHPSLVSFRPILSQFDTLSKDFSSNWSQIKTEAFQDLIRQMKPKLLKGSAIQRREIKLFHDKVVWAGTFLDKWYAFQERVSLSLVGAPDLQRTLRAFLMPQLHTLDTKTDTIEVKRFGERQMYRASYGQFFDVKYLRDDDQRRVDDYFSKHPSLELEPAESIAIPGDSDLDGSRAVARLRTKLERIAMWLQ